MSTSKKPLLKKRKRQSPPPSTTSQISRRLEKLRSAQRNLWEDRDDDDDDDQNAEQHVQSKITTNNKTYIVLSDSDDEKTSSRQRPRNNKSKKKSSRIHDEHVSSDNDCQMPSKCATCLICSILTTLTSYNCCSKHLSLLINNKNSHSNHQKQTTDMQQWSPQQVMIVPMTDELIQRYLNPQEIYRLRTRTATSPIQKEPVQSKRSTRKKSTITSEPSDTEHSNITKSKSKPKSKSSKKSPHIEPEQISSLSSITDSALPNSGTSLPDLTYTVITSTSTTINSFESPNVLDTCQLQQSSDQPIITDDSQPDNQQENVLINNTHENRQNDPWTPISDDTYRAIEIALEQIDQTSQEQPEFTPAIARRTPTELMASRLPKIQLKKGRYRQGKPINDKNTPDTTTNESRSMNISQSSSTSTSSSVIVTNTRPPPSLATIIEDESLIIQSTRQISDKSSQSVHILSQRHDNASEGLSDTVMSSLLAQDESSQHDNIHITTKTISNEALPVPAIIIEDYSRVNDINKSIDVSQSSQLTNDQSDTQTLISSTTNEKPTTPARVSYRTNPDGSRVSISRPPLSTNHRSSLTSLRRASIDVISITSQTNK